MNNVLTATFSTIASTAQQAQKKASLALAKNFRSTVVALAAAGCAAAASATPLSLSYNVQSNGSGLFLYDFALTLDNNDSTWRPGQTFNWIIFGDAKMQNSPLTNFVGNTAPAPFSRFSVSSGWHNGPTFLGDNWVPGALGDTLRWSGTSSANLGQGQLLFSNIMGSGVHADFEAAHLRPASLSRPAPATAVPEPATGALVLAALAASVAATRKRRAN